MDDLDLDLCSVAFLDPFFNIWSFLDIKDLVAFSCTRGDLGDVEVMGFVANELFSNFQMPLIFDNEASYSTRYLISQLKKYSSLSSPLIHSPQGENEVPNENVFYGIVKHLESASYDEYDDFTPRHPVPKDKVHRRGDSYFNSDVGDAAMIALDSASIKDIKKLASVALYEVEEELLGPGSSRSSQNLHHSGRVSLSATDDIIQSRSVFS